MIVKEFQNKKDDKVSADYERMYVYYFCDKCNDQITTIIMQYGDLPPSYTNISNERLAKMIIGGVKRIDGHLSKYIVAKDAGIIVDDEYYCKSCWSETKLKSQDFKERIDLLRKA